MASVIERLDAAIATLTELRAELKPAELAPNVVTGGPLAWGKKMGPELSARCHVFAQDFKCDPNWLPACMAFETMETFRPNIRPLRKDGSRISSAVGLIQFLERTAKELGTTTAKLAGMSAVKQFDFVWLYFRNSIRRNGPIASLEDCYMHIHWPAAVGDPLDSTMYVRGTDAYAANAGLDTNKDHKITKREAGALVRAKLDKGLLPANRG